MTAASGVHPHLQAVPRPVPGEIARPQLIERLRARWDHRVTTLVAGPGFGKTTALAQAVRDAAPDRHRVDLWLAAGAASGDATLLADELLTAVGGDRSASDPVAAVTAAIARRHPHQVCLIIDDAHEVAGEGGAATGLVAAVIRSLPPNGHLVLAGRTTDGLPLTRLQAAGDLLRLGVDDLVFAAGEVRALAARVGRPAPPAAELGGWPALVHLAVAAHHSAPWDFLREEVLASLDAGELTTLAALACLGVASESQVEEVADQPVAVAALAARLPLITVRSDDRFRCHDLWYDGLARIVPASQWRQLQERAVATLLADGRLPDAGRRAIDARRWDLLQRACLGLVRHTLSATPLDLAQTWLDTLPSRWRSEPEALVLRAAVAQGRDYADTSVDDVLDEALAAFRARGDSDGCAVVLALATIAAHGRGDPVRLVSLAAEAGHEPLDRSDPIVRLLRHGVAAVGAELAGDVDGALDHLAQAGAEAVPRPVAMPIHRFHAHCLLMAGRPGDAVAHAARHLADGGNAHSRVTETLARWLDGDPTGFPLLTRSAPSDPAIGERDRFNGDAFVTIIGCSGGLVIGGTGSRSAGSESSGRDSALAALAEAATAVVGHDEPRAGAVLAGHLARHPMTDPLSERHLHRFLALGYVLDARLRARWDSAALRPGPAKQRAVARALVDLRTGPRTAMRFEPTWAVCFLPLPWSAELACRLVPVDARHAVAVAVAVAETAGRRLAEELRWLATSPDPDLRRGAGRLLRTVPIPTGEHLEVDVLGPVGVRLDGRSVDGTVLRRSRVRQLLGALVVHRTIDRDHLAGLLWPDFDTSGARRNLRVNLSYLRRLLEPGRPRGEAGHRLRIEGERIALCPSPDLAVDLWEFDRLMDEAMSFRAAGDCATTADRLEAALALWRGRPLDDLRAVPDLEPAIERTLLCHDAARRTLTEIRRLEGDDRAAYRLHPRPPGDVTDATVE